MSAGLFVLRKGAFYLQGSNGWGQRACATELSKRDADKALAEWTTILGGALSPAKLAEVLALEPVSEGQQQGLFG